MFCCLIGHEHRGSLFVYYRVQIFGGREKPLAYKNFKWIHTCDFTSRFAKTYDLKWILTWGRIRHNVTYGIYGLNRIAHEFRCEISDVKWFNKWRFTCMLRILHESMLCNLSGGVFQWISHMKPCVWDFIWIGMQWFTSHWNDCDLLLFSCSVINLFLSCSILFRCWWMRLAPVLWLCR